MIEQEFLKSFAAKEHSNHEKFAVAIQCLVKAADILELSDRDKAASLTNIIEKLVKKATNAYAQLVDIWNSCKELESQPYLDPEASQVASTLTHRIMTLTNQIYNSGIEAWEMKQKLEQIDSVLSKLMVMPLEDSAPLVGEIHDKLQHVKPMNLDPVKSDHEFPSSDYWK